MRLSPIVAAALLKFQQQKDALLGAMKTNKAPVPPDRAPSPLWVAPDPLDAPITIEYNLELAPASVQEAAPAPKVTTQVAPVEFNDMEVAEWLLETGQVAPNLDVVGWFVNLPEPQQAQYRQLYKSAQLFKVL